MILFYGELLADLIGIRKDGFFAYERHAGGAPFNAACACKRSGGNCGFVGSVGDDLVGKYLRENTAACGFDLSDISVLPDRNTTLAFVELDGHGERSFCFYRKNTADYILKEETLAYIEKADIVHLGSLMLNEKEGMAFADKVVAETKRAGKKLSFDINYRDDLFPDPRKAKEVYSGYAEAADIVKYSEEELVMFTGASGEEGLRALARPDKLVCVTLGDKGSAYAAGDAIGSVPSIKVRPVDTTGAGDAFYGALLSRLDGKDFTELSHEELHDIFGFANVAGAIATTARGATDCLPSEKDILKAVPKIGK